MFLVKWLSYAVTSATTDYNINKGAFGKKLKAPSLFVVCLICAFMVNSCAGTPRYTNAANGNVSDIQGGRVFEKRIRCHPCNWDTTKKNVASPSPGNMNTGKASFYGDKFHGRKTASGEIYDRALLTGAHRTLPFGTMVKVTNNNNGLSVVIRINDRGPHKRGRIIDLSYTAAEKINMISRGIVPVTIEVIDSP